MFVGNTTLLRTVNDTLTSGGPSSSLSSSQYSAKRLSTFFPMNSQENEYVSYNSISDESNHYDEIDSENKREEIPKEVFFFNDFFDRSEISFCFYFFFIQICDNIVTHDDARSSSNSSSFAAGLNSDEISSATSNDYFQAEEIENESMYELDALIHQVQTYLDDLRLLDPSFSIVFDKIEQKINDLDNIIKVQIQEQTEKTLEVENVLGDFNFLNTFDDEDTLKTIDSGFEGDQQQQQNIKQNESLVSNLSHPMNAIFVDILNRISTLLYVSFSLLIHKICISVCLILISIFKIAQNLTIILFLNVLTISMNN